ncbi:MAG: hypothetical protein CL677_09275, partial [Bdellovibrionaceae bacterium]|nr:hypothetical protein [Pseudobdellovibrionaceae bacterium]
MKLSNLNFLLILMSSAAFAQPNLEADHKRSSGWELQTIYDTDSLEKLGDGYLTESGKFRINKLSADSTGDIELVTSKRVSLSKLKNECFETTGKLDSWRYSDMAVDLVVKLPVLRALDSSKVFIQSASGDNNNLPDIENPISLTEAAFKVALKNQSYTQRNFVSVNYMAQVLNGRLISRSADLLSNAKAIVNITDYPSLTCDVVSGKASLSLDLLYSGEEARHRTKKTLRANEVASLANSIATETSVRGYSNEQALVISGALMAEGMKSSWRKGVNEFGGDNFIKMHRQLYNSNRKRWNRLSATDHSRISDLFFEVLPLENRNDYSNVDL